MYASTLPRSNWLRRASIGLAWYRHMSASSMYFKIVPNFCNSARPIPRFIPIICAVNVYSHYNRLRCTGSVNLLNVTTTFKTCFTVLNVVKIHTVTSSPFPMHHTAVHPTALFDLSGHSTVIDWRRKKHVLNNLTSFSKRDFSDWSKTVLCLYIIFWGIGRST